MFLFNQLFLWNNFHNCSVFARAFVFDDTVACSKDCVIFTFFGVNTRINSCSSLTVDNATCVAPLSIGDFRAKSTSSRITSVFCGTDTFFTSKELEI